jgi:hypothetical protein
MAKSFTGKTDFHTKTARPANVGPHDVTKDQHDPDRRGVTPADYKPHLGDNTPSPAVPGGPANIPPKGAAGEGTGGRPDDARPDTGVTPETRAKARGLGKQDTGGLAEE